MQIHDFDNKLIFLINKIKKGEEWTPMEDKLLLIIARNHGCKNWKAISKHFTNKSDVQCYSRFKRICRNGILGYWTLEEDERLLSLYQQYGKNWKLISMHMLWRTSKQIRDRFINSLDPNLNKSQFTPEEDQKIIETYKRIGSKWTKIAQLLEGRNGDMVKNRFYSFLKKIKQLTNQALYFNYY